MELEPLGDRDPRELGPYHLRGRLRVGRLGPAYLGRSADGLFAEVTVVGEQIAWDPQVLALLTEGADGARRLRADHVQRVRDADLAARTPWIAADFLPGPSLREAVEAHGPLPAAAVRSLAVALADALAAVHGSGQVHRGLDPSSVVLTADGPVVTGLGLARALEAVTVTLPRLVPDAVAYLAPEVARGLEPGSPADVFGIGAVLTYAVTGRGPFGSGASGELARRMRDDEPDLTGLPDDLVEPVAAAVRANPGERPTLAALRRRLAAGSPGAWVLPAGLTGDLAQWAVLGRGRSAPLAPAIPAEPTARITPVAPVARPARSGSGPSAAGALDATEQLDTAGPDATEQLDTARLDATETSALTKQLDTARLDVPPGDAGTAAAAVAAGGSAETGPAVVGHSSGPTASGAPAQPVSILPRGAQDDRSASGSGRSAGGGAGPGSRTSLALMIAVGVAVAALVFAAVTLLL
ncbi:serine/threonine protein kinase [Promicromonospora sp. NPDC060204]|uniref:serine/threonine protein kinase n=1 Tax=Promicromonospora sp. NPDC060204 TaxID=3347071 RepID=UPI00364D073A